MPNLLKLAFASDLGSPEGGRPPFIPEPGQSMRQAKPSVDEQLGKLQSGMESLQAGQTAKPKGVKGMGREVLVGGSQMMVPMLAMSALGVGAKHPLLGLGLGLGGYHIMKKMQDPSHAGALGIPGAIVDKIRSGPKGGMGRNILAGGKKLLRGLRKGGSYITTTPGGEFRISTGGVMYDALLEKYAVDPPVDPGLKQPSGPLAKLVAHLRVGGRRLSGGSWKETAQSQDIQKHVKSKLPMSAHLRSMLMPEHRRDKFLSEMVGKLPTKGISDPTTHDISHGQNLALATARRNGRMRMLLGGTGVGLGLLGSAGIAKLLSGKPNYRNIMEDEANTRETPRDSRYLNAASGA